MHFLSLGAVIFFFLNLLERDDEVVQIPGMQGGEKKKEGLMDAILGSIQQSIQSCSQP